MSCRPCKCHLLLEQSVKYVDFRVAPLTVREQCNSRGGAEAHPGTDWPCVAKAVASAARCSRLSCYFFNLRGKRRYVNQMFTWTTFLQQCFNMLGCSTASKCKCHAWGSGMWGIPMICKANTVLSVLNVWNCCLIIVKIS